MGRNKINHIDWLQQLEKRHPGIRDQFRKMFKNPYWTLTKIGEEYNLSRERTRQLFYKIYGLGAKDLEDLRKKQKSEDLSCIYDPRYKVAEYVEGLVKKGAIAEKIIWDRCEALAFDVKPGPDTTYDLEINGFKVDVKSAWKTLKTSPKSSLMYHFGIQSNQNKICDFLICVKMPREEAYIIPSSEFPKSKKSGSIYIRKNLNNKRKKFPTSKWEQYREAWHLLTEDFNPAVWPQEVNG